MTDLLAALALALIILAASAIYTTLVVYWALKLVDEIDAHDKGE